MEFVYRFFHPWFLVLLPIPFILLAIQLRGEKKKTPSVVYSDSSFVGQLPKTLKVRALRFLPWVRCLALCLGVIALARPQYGFVEYTTSALGIDIALVLDVSGSMQETDFLPNRLEAAKEAAIEFVDNRKTDRVSVVLFGESAAVLCPPTLDMETAKLFLSSVQDKIISNQRTAIGEGLALAVKQMEQQEEKTDIARSRVAILLTDGENNAGKINPMQAAEIAKALNVRVYTIGVGGGMRARGRTFNFRAPASFDAEALKEISEMTDGQYFHATDEKSLNQIYAEIDQLEKTEIETDETADFNEKFMFAWFPALLLLGLEFFLRAFWLRRIP